MTVDQDATLLCRNGAQRKARNVTGDQNTPSWVGVYVLSDLAGWGKAAAQPPARVDTG
jgi:hypothetical protein